MPIIGHKKIISYFDSAIKDKMLSQSYCFVGYDQVGKRTVARNICSKLLKVEEPKLDLYPDFCYIARQEDEKTGKLKKDISISQARQIKDKVGRRAWMGEYQTVILDEAELLNEEAANALLKILEETKGQCMFFLLTVDDSALLPTIRSRCQMFYFPLVGKEEIKSSLVKMGYSEAVAEEAAKFSWGRPGRAVELAFDDDLRKSYNQEIERWTKIIPSPFFKKMELVDDFFGDKMDAVRGRDKIQRALDIWIMIWRDVMLDKMQNSSATPAIGKIDLSAADISSLIDDLHNAQILLGRNINPKLLIEQILLKFS